MSFIAKHMNDAVTARIIQQHVPSARTDFPEAGEIVSTRRIRTEHGSFTYIEMTHADALVSNEIIDSFERDGYNADSILEAMRDHFDACAKAVFN